MSNERSFLETLMYWFAVNGGSAELLFRKIGEHAFLHIYLSKGDKRMSLIENSFDDLDRLLIAKRNEIFNGFDLPEMPL